MSVHLATVVSQNLPEKAFGTPYDSHVSIVRHGIVGEQRGGVGWGGGAAVVGIAGRELE